MIGEKSKQIKKEQWHTQLWLQKIVLSACLIEHNYKEGWLPMSNSRGFR
jgi:hypothetical protein